MKRKLLIFGQYLYILPSGFSFLIVIFSTSFRLKVNYRKIVVVQQNWDTISRLTPPISYTHLLIINSINNDKYNYREAEKGFNSNKINRNTHTEMERVRVGSKEQDVQDARRLR